MKTTYYSEETLRELEYMRAYEQIQPQLEITRILIYALETQHLSVQELSERTGVSLTDLNKLNSGTHNPQLKLLQSLADGLGLTLQIRFLPKGFGAMDDMETENDYLPS